MEVISMKGALDLPQNVGGDELQIVVPEAIESTEEARGDWGVFPAWGARVIDLEAVMLRESTDRTSFLQCFPTLQELP